MRRRLPSAHAIHWRPRFPRPRRMTNGVSTVKGEQLPPPCDEVVEKVRAATEVVEAAEKFLGICISEVEPAKIARRNARARYTSMLMEWSKVDSTPKNDGDLVKERIATETKIKLRQHQERVARRVRRRIRSRPWGRRTDQFRAGQGKGHSADRGYNLNKMRGAQLPSEK